MENPRLKINDKELGLRDLGDGLFEPKNLNIFNQILEGKKDFDNNPKALWEEIPIPKNEPHKYHKIESFCFVATDNLKDEAEVLLRTLRLFHQEPVYVICDKETRVFLNRQKLCENVKFRTCAEQDQLDAIQE